MFVRNCEVTDEAYTQNATDAEALNLYDQRVIMWRN